MLGCFELHQILNLVACVRLCLRLCVSLCLVSGFLTLCYLYPTGGSKNRPKILARRHLLTNQICILLFYFRA